MWNEESLLLSNQSSAKSTLYLVLIGYAKCGFLELLSFVIHIKQYKNIGKEQEVIAMIKVMVKVAALILTSSLIPPARLYSRCIDAKSGQLYLKATACLIASAITHGK